MKEPRINLETIRFLKQLEKNNNRTWFAEQKPNFKRYEGEFKDVMETLKKRMEKHDEIEKLKLFRIYRDVRFSKNKEPYKTNFGCSFSRSGAKLRGGYYVHIQPGKSFIATGFWQPNKEDLLRIRKELESDASDFRTAISNKSLTKYWGALNGEELKTAPKGFDREHENIDLIRRKQFIFTKEYADKEVTSKDFTVVVNEAFKSIRPFFDLMSDILTTNLNGEPLL